MAIKAANPLAPFWYTPAGADEGEGTRFQLRGLTPFELADVNAGADVVEGQNKWTGRALRSALRTGLLGKNQQVGDFDFARHNVGTGFEGFMVLGEGVFLICNNTVQSMDAIAQDPRWLEAQVPFVELSEKFRSDPLVPPQ